TGTAPTTTTSGWGRVTTNFGISQHHAKINIYGTTPKYWLVTPTIDLGTGNSNYQLDFNLALTDYGNGDSIEAKSTSDDIFMVIISTDNGATWSQANAIIWDTLGTNYVYRNIPREGQHITIPLGTYTGQIKIAFYGESTVTGGDNDLHIGNIHVGTPITCFPITNITRLSSTTTSMDLSWTDSGSAASWLINYKAYDDTILHQEEAFSIPYTIQNLLPGTMYQVYIQALCNGTDTSIVLERPLFATQCETVTVYPWTESFENTWFTSSGLYTEARPYCWMNINGGSSANKWRSTTTAGYVHSGSKSAQMYGGTTATSMNSDWLISPIVSLYGYQGLKFWAKGYNTENSSATYINDLSVYIYDVTTNGDIDDFSDTTLFTQIMPSTIIPQVVWSEYVVNLSQFVGDYRIAFVRNSRNAGNLMSIDDVSIDELSLCIRPTTVAIIDSTLTANEVEIEWTPGHDYDAAWYLYYKPEGATDYDSIFVNASPFQLTNLIADTTYSVYMRTDCSSELSLPSSPIYFTTPCNAITTIPLVENFDDYGTGSSNYMDCWKKLGTSTNPYPSTTYEVSGVASLYFYASGAGAYSIAISPQFDQTIPVNSLRANFKLRKSSAASSLTIGVMTNPADASTFDSITAVSPISTTAFEDFEVLLNSYQGTGRYIAFKVAYYGSTNTIYMDDLVISAIPACARPQNPIDTNSTINSIDLSWTNGHSTDASWWIFYKQNTSSLWDSINVFTNPYTLQNLSSSTIYDYYIKTDCSDELSEQSDLSSFTTACDIVSIFPYTENFDNLGSTAGQYPLCWERPIMYSGYPNTSVSATRVHSAPASLEIHSALTAPSYAVTPELGEDINLLKVNFWLKAENIVSSGRMEIGVMSDANDTSTFELVSTIQPTSTDYIEYEILFNNTILNGTNKYIAFRHFPISTIYYYWLDDVVVDFIPPCAAPGNITISNVTTSDAEISWQNANQNDYAWWLYFKPINQTTFDSIYVTSNPFILPNLTSANGYEIFMATDCNGEISPYSEVKTFYAGCDMITLFPWFEGFEDNWVIANEFGNMNAPLCWTNLNKGAGATHYWQRGTTRRTGSGAAYIPTGSNDMNNDWLISPKISLTGNQRLRFWILNSTATTEDKDEISVWISDADLMINTASVGDYDSIPGFTQIYQDSILTGPWQEIELNLSQYSGNRYIAFARRNEPHNGLNLRLDDVSVLDIPLCDRPTNLTLSNITTNSVDIAWTPANTTDNSWYIYYDNGIQLDSTLVTSSPYTLQAIDHSTLYTIYMKTNCGTTISESTNPQQFRTNCDIITTLPWTENFDTYGTGTGTFPNCWNRITTNSTYPYVSTTNVSAPGSLYFYVSVAANDELAISPEFDSTISLNSLMVRFNMRSSKTTLPLIIGVMTNPTDLLSFTPLDSIFVSTINTWEEFDVNLNNYTGIGRHIAFRVKSITGSVYIDNILVQTIPTCTRPNIPTVSNISQNSAEIAWTDPNINNTLYDVYYRILGTTTWNIDQSSTNPHTIQNLAHSAQYEVAVATNCGTEISELSAIKTFQTECGASTLPTLVESFITVPGVCWTRFTGLLSETTDATLTSSTAGWLANSYVTPHNIRVNLYNTNQNYWLVSPTIDLGDGTIPAQLEFDVFATDFNSISPLEYPWENDKKFIVLISTDNGTTWNYSNKLMRWDNSGADSVLNNIPNTPQHISIQLTNQSGVNYTGQVKFAFYAESSVNGDADNDLHIDNFQVNYFGLLPCAEPTSVVVSNITSSSAQINWVAGANETNWQIRLGTSGAPIDLTSNTYTFNNLIPSTNYVVYVRAYCGVLYSEWVPSTLFTTQEGILAPIVTTLPANNQTHASATLNASYVIGNETILSKGFAYKVSTTPIWTIQNVTDTSTTFSYSATQLTSNSTYDVKAFVVTPTDTTFGDIVNFTTLPVVLPNVTTDSVSNITQTSAIFYGTIQPNTEEIEARGFQYKLTTETWEDAINISATGVNSINSNPTTLTSGNIYEVRAYARTATATSYGSVISFGTLALGQVSTNSPDQETILDHSVTLSGTIISTGNELPSNIQVGFVYSTTSNPIIGADGVTQEPVTYTEDMTDFIKNITGLQSNTDYFFKSYLTNTVGTVYGNEVNFMTLDIKDAQGKEISIMMYPNPANSKTNLIVTGVNGETKISLSDVQGRILNTTNTKAVNGVVEQTINLDNLAKGVYYVRIQNSQINKTQKLIVK
ncbi:MAG: choice-of-anchor J domain-containing protein, partial [Bacteroidales bacterium]